MVNYIENVKLAHELNKWIPVVRRNWVLNPILYLMQSINEFENIWKFENFRCGRRGHVKKWKLRKNDIHDPPIFFWFLVCQRCSKRKRPKLYTLGYFKSLKLSHIINHTKKVFISCSDTYSRKSTKSCLYVFLGVYTYYINEMLWNGISSD